MSRQFTAVALFVTTTPATDFDHNGDPLTLDGYPVGTVLALDECNDIFRCNQPEVANSITRRKFNSRSVRLFRDYWSFVMTYQEATVSDRDADMSPINRCILNTSPRLVCGTDPEGLFKEDSK